MQCDQSGHLDVVRAPTLSRRNAVAAAVIVLVCFAGLLAPLAAGAQSSLLLNALIVLFDLAITAGLSVALYRYQRDSRKLSEYRASIDALQHIGVLLLDQDGTVLDCNPGAEKLTGYARRQLIGRNFSVCYAIDDQAAGRPLEALRRAVAEGTLEDGGWRVRKDGTRFWASVTLTPLYDREHRLKGFSKITRDSTLRKITEDQANDHAALLDAVVNGTFDIIFLKNAELQYELINAAGSVFLGRPDTEIIGKTDFELFSPDTAEHRHQSDVEVLETGSPKMYEEGIEVNGVRRTFLINKSAWRDHEGRIVGVIGIATDITARRQVKNAEARASDYHRLFNDAPVPYHELDTDGVIRRVNHAECELMGRTAEEMIGRRITEFIDVPDLERMAQMGSEEVGPYDRTYVRGDGTRVTVEVHERSIRDRDGRLIGTRAALINRNVAPGKPPVVSTRDRATKKLA